MNTVNSIYALNSLIIINNDRIEGYEIASKETEEPELKNMFYEFQRSSQKFKAELMIEIKKLGGIPIKERNDSNIFGAISRDIKNFLFTKDRDDILSTCEYDDFIAFQNYNEILNNNFVDLAGEIQEIVLDQQKFIKADHDKLKFLNDMMLGYK